LVIIDTVMFYFSPQSPHPACAPIDLFA